ncbi:MAG TPA: hypothetical protein VNM34_15360 [Verrucomicrobiae bacterium]|nr:hypothetical protein [Verrucomicrobiae bacterium]
MFTNQQLLERIEDAERLTPFCDQCGAPTVVVECEGALLLECSALVNRPSRLRSLLTLDFASLHTQRSIAQLPIAA